VPRTGCSESTIQPWTRSRTTRPPARSPPEDIRPGDAVGILQIHAEVFWPFDDEYLLRARGPLLRFTCLPCGPLQPLEVVSVCLPFVLVRQPDGRHLTLDIRRCRLARLSEEFARKATKRLRPAPSKKEG